jgi:hypothetical protein
MTFVRKYQLIFGGVFFLMSALQLVRFFNQPSDIWWTPEALALPLADGADRVKVYVGRTELGELADAGRVHLVADSGATPVARAEIRLRINNRDRVRAERLPMLLVHAVTLGASGVVFLSGLLGWGQIRRMHAGG